MKLGVGKVYKVCVILCILGDILFLFFIKYVDNIELVYLVIDLVGKVIKDEIFFFVVDLIQVFGEVGWQDDMFVFCIDLVIIFRLGSCVKLLQILCFDDDEFVFCYYKDLVVG